MISKIDGVRSVRMIWRMLKIRTLTRIRETTTINRSRGTSRMEGVEISDG